MVSFSRAGVISRSSMGSRAGPPQGLSNWTLTDGISEWRGALFGALDSKFGDEARLAPGTGRPMPRPRLWPWGARAEKDGTEARPWGSSLIKSC